MRALSNRSSIPPCPGRMLPESLMPMTYRDIQVNVAYRWFLGYSLLEEIPHFATVSYAFCKRLPPELSEEIFAHILNKALNNRMVDPSMIFIAGTHIKASANKKKLQKEQVAKAAKEMCIRDRYCNSAPRRPSFLSSQTPSENQRGSPI